MTINSELWILIFQFIHPLSRLLAYSGLINNPPWVNTKLICELNEHGYALCKKLVLKYFCLRMKLHARMTNIQMKNNNLRGKVNRICVSKKVQIFSKLSFSLYYIICTKYICVLNIFDFIRSWTTWIYCVLRTVCPRSSDPFHIVTYYIKWVTTSWTDGT